MKRFWKENKRIYLAILIAVALLLGIMTAANIMLNMKLSDAGDQVGKEKTYKYHIAMISEDPSDVFWASVYKGAREEGEDRGMYIQNFGEKLSKDYSVEELTQMAVAAKVDGIIVEAANRKSMKEAIAEAEKADIPVITVLGDIPDSERKSFVSANDYTLGEQYGEQVMKTIRENYLARIGTEEEIPRVAVLVHSEGEESTPNLVYSGISEAVTKNQQRVSLSAVAMGGNKEFEGEEIIRNLLLDTKERPDVLVCLSATDSISAYQCILDYNLVGKISMIGYYSSEDILDGIKKGIVESTIVINAQEMGRTSASGMYDYLEQEYVSEYLTVESKLITQDNVNEYMEQTDEQEEEK